MVTVRTHGLVLAVMDNGNGDGCGCDCDPRFQTSVVVSKKTFGDGYYEVATRREAAVPLAGSCSGGTCCLASLQVVGERACRLAGATGMTLLRPRT